MRKFGKESTAPEGTGDSHGNSGKGWLKNHWCALSICVILVVAFLLRTVFAYGISADGDFALSGGASAQYHLHIIESILDGSFSLSDLAVNYPIGGTNLYPPLMDFVVAIPAMILTSLGFTATEAASAALAGFNPVIGALTVIPVFLVANELFGKKTGVVAALIFAFLALPISTSVFSSGTEYAFAAFLIAFMSYFAVKMVKAMDAEAETRKPVYINAVLTGLFLGLAALTWNGFRILLVLFVVAMFIQLLLDRFRGKDLTLTAVSYSIVLLLGVVIAAPYYMAAGLWDAVFSGPLLVAVVGVVFAFAFKALQAKPWVLTIPALLVAFAVFLVALYFGANDLFTDFVSGNSIYSSSIMESLVSNRVSMSNVAAYYGWLTMWLPICLAIYETYVLAKRDRSNTQVFTVVWLFALFFSVWTSYANAAVVGVVFAVGSGAAIIKVLEKADLRSWVNTMKTAGFPGVFRKMIKPLPFVSVLVVALLVVVPNFSFAVDAGIPNNSDADHYFSGNTQFVIKTGDKYPVGDVWDEYKDVDKNGNALVTWIDYTYDAVAQGGFITVADTVGGGSSEVAQMLLAEGTAGSLAAYTLRIVMSGNLYDYAGYLPETVVGYIEDPSKAIAEIEAHPAVYGNIRSDITDTNAVYLASIEYMTTNMSEKEIADMYDNVCRESGERIGYVLVDGTMLPLQYGDNSVFSTIAYFAGYSTDGYGAASEYFSYNTYYGTTEYTEKMYDTFLWKSLIGPSAADAGFTNSYSYLVALSHSDGKEGSAMAVPGYGLTGYEVAFWNVQYNPDNNAVVGDDGWVYMNGYEAIAKQKAEGGVINYLSGIVLLEYVGVQEDYQDVPVRDESGNAVNGAVVKVMVYNDDLGKYVEYSSAKTIDGVATVAKPADQDFIVRAYMGGYNMASFVGFPSEIVIESATLSGYVYVGDKVLTGVDLGFTLEGAASGAVPAENIHVADGKITVDRIMPDVYTYKLYDTEGKQIADGTVKVMPGDNTGLIVKPKTYTITATVEDVFGAPVDGCNIYAINTSTGYQFDADVKDGEAVIDVLPGNYTVTLGNGMVSMSTTNLSATSGNRSVTVTAYESKTVNIEGGEGVTFIVSAGQFSTASYDNGTKVDIPVGLATVNELYTLYGVQGDKVYTGVYTGGDSASVTASDAVNATGKLKNGDKDTLGTVRFTNSENATFVASAGTDGKFSIMIPAGDYTIVADNGNDKVFVGKKTVSGDMGDISLVDGRKVSYTLRYDPQLGSSSYMKLPFVLGLVQYTYEGVDYQFYTMSNKDGEISFYIPDNVKCVLSFNNPEGTLENELFLCQEVKKEVDEGTSNNSNTTTIKVKINDNDKNIIKECKVTSEYMDPMYKMKMTLTEDEDVTYDFSKDTPETIQPGEYDVVIDGSSGWYYKGTAYVYPGSTEIVGIDAKEVFAVEITKANADVLTIDKGEGDYYIDGNTYYFVKGYEYSLKSINNTTVDGKNVQLIKYGFIDATGNTVDAKLDMTATAEKMTITGYIGVPADGKLTVTYDKVQVVFDVKSGAYTVVLPSDVKSATFAVEATTMVDGDEFVFKETREVTGLEDGAVRNIAVVSSDDMPEPEEDEKEPEFEATLDSATFVDGNASVTVTVTNNTDKQMTYTLANSKGWVMDKVVTVTIDGKGSKTVTANGYYDPAKVAVGADGLAVIVTDVNASRIVTLKITENTAAGSGSLGEEILVIDDGGDAFKDKISAYEYMYAITFVNKDNYSKTATLSIQPVEGWTVTIMDENGTTVLAPGETSEFTIYGYQTTVLYVKLMPVDGMTDKTVPGITGTATIGSTSKNLNLQPEEISLDTDGMNASGTEIYNEEKGVPSGIWFLVAVSILMLIATVWLASKRGVFARKN